MILTTRPNRFGPGSITLMIMLACPLGCTKQTAEFDVPEQQSPVPDTEAVHADSIDSSAEENGWTSLTSAGENYIVRYRIVGGDIKVNEQFSIEAIVQDARSASEIDDAHTLAVDARMPHHRHGMLREPAVERGDEGRFRINGMLFHMPGRWELYFDMTYRGITERAMDIIHLE